MPKCKFYLRDFIIRIMKKTEFVPAAKRFFCSSCLVTKKLPPAGYGKVTAGCKDCKQLVTESWADMITYLACCVSTKVSGVEPEPPIKETASHEEVGRWIHKLSASQLISFEAVLAAANVPGFTYGQLLLDCSVEELAQMQPRAYVTH